MKRRTQVVLRPLKKLIGEEEADVEVHSTNPWRGVCK